VADSDDTFNEDAIRPDALMEESDRLHAGDLAKLLQRRAEFVEVSCPACGSEKRDRLWTKDGFHYDRCDECATAYVNPRPPPALLEEYYATAENYRYWSKEIFPAAEATRRLHIARPRVERVIDICERSDVRQWPVLLEVGAGHGTFCAEAVESGHFGRVIAVEPTPSNAEACRNRGIEVIARPIEQVALDGHTADVVASFEVIEHLFDPRAFVEGCAGALPSGGLLVLSCPNLKGFEVAALGVGSRTVDAEHLNYFHPESLALLLQRCGLDVLELSTPGRLDAEIVRKRALAGFLNLEREPFLKTLLIEEWHRIGPAFQRFLADNRLAAHMWAVARKP
jgi:2-polyprenyl-3-methyl-5-hydroxy-6-metoxy-1,4-benzoquinol methylase